MVKANAKPTLKQPPKTTPKPLQKQYFPNILLVIGSLLALALAVVASQSAKRDAEIGCQAHPGADITLKLLLAAAIIFSLVNLVIAVKRQSGLYATLAGILLLFSIVFTPALLFVTYFCFTF